MKMTSPYNAPAFTRLELAALLGALALLALVTLPMTAGPATRADRIACVNNLRQIGQAFNIWASEHQDSFPWRTTYIAGDPNSGTQGHTLHESLWFQYSRLSNELTTPKVLSCPADQRIGKKTATSWDMNPQGGLLNGACQNNAVSYLLSVHAEPNLPRSILAMDRNLRFPSRTQCAYGFASVAFIQFSHGPFLPGLVMWTNDVHGLSGIPT